MDSLDKCLSAFGITQSKNEHGKLRWTINVVSDDVDGNAQPRLATFDSELGVWKLKHATDGNPRDLPLRSSATTELSKPISRSQTDWTVNLPPSDHTDLFRSLDWASTPLGHYDAWPHSLRLYTHMLFSDNRAGSIYWGPQRIALYNSFSVPLLGALHPSLFGCPLEEVMPELWSSFGPTLAAIEQDQEGLAQNDLEISIVRDGFLEETWWAGGIMPLLNDDGDHGGTYFSWTEITGIILRDRRSKMIMRLGQSSHTTISSIWEDICKVFTDFERDITMAIMYSVNETNPGDGALHLEHTIGIGPTYAAAPSVLDATAKDEDSPLAPLLRRALESPAKFVVIDTSKEVLDASLLDNVDWRGFGEPSCLIVIVALRSKNANVGFITFGLNPRRMFDTDHEQFVVDLVEQLQELMMRATTEDITQKREEYLVTELTERERRIGRIAEIVPVGIYELAADGSLHWANTRFWEIMDVPVDQRNYAAFDWQDYILPEDHGRALQEMGKSLMEGVGISDSLRLKRRYEPPEMGDGRCQSGEPFWIIYTASPTLQEGASTVSLTGSLTDISQLKWSEQLHDRRAETARREKKGQEEFIDITSHELRNPLGCITQCADSIIQSLQTARNTTDLKSLMDIFELNVEAAESILFCAIHQRRIIDDVLTLGKLDSKLLTICPTTFQPQDLVDQTMQILKSEIDVNEIEAQMCVDDTSILRDTSYACGDFSRLMQILVNLLTNAIKFTKLQQTRRISVRFGMSHTIPSPEQFGPNFKWYTTGASRPDLTLDAEYGRGPTAYLYYAVVDSGRGIPPEYVSKIFTKFEQADRRTYTTYGGSGLGLYISQELTEMQGGCIGLESSDGIGSTFAFYTKVRLSDVGSPPLISSTVSTTQHASIATETTQPLDPVPSQRISITSAVPQDTQYNILLVEDNLLNQKILARQLRSAGCIVRVCSNGGEAIDTILQMNDQSPEFGTLPSADSLPHFDCILMDWEMPVCDGLKATKRIREIELSMGGTKNVIIGVTANARAEQIATAMKAGMHAVMPKPFRVAELLAKIGHLVGQHRKEEEN